VALTPKYSDLISYDTAADVMMMMMMMINKIRKLRKTVILGTAHTYCGKCYCRSTEEFNTEDSAIRTINSRRGIAATLCTLETWFFQVYKCEYPA
jgi:hypothetical protein